MIQLRARFSVFDVARPWFLTPGLWHHRAPVGQDRRGQRHEHRELALAPHLHDPGLRGPRRLFPLLLPGFLLGRRHRVFRSEKVGP